MPIVHRTPRQWIHDERLRARQERKGVDDVSVWRLITNLDRYKAIHPFQRIFLRHEGE